MATSWSRRAANAWYYTRVVAITSGAYSIGYQQAVIAFARDPAAMDSSIVLGLTQGNAQLGASTPEYKYIEHIGRKVIAAGKIHCRLKIAELGALQKKVSALQAKPVASGVGVAKEDLHIDVVVPDRLALPSDNANAAALKLGVGHSDAILSAASEKISEEVAFWQAALAKMDRKWSFIVCNSPTANAFVSDMAPYRIFVFSGLVERLQLSPDELAFCLAHEISHSLLGHTQQKSDVEYALTQLHMLLLISLPELIFVQEVVSAIISSLIQSGFSRSFESEADMLGVCIATRACYDPSKGANLFNKLASFEKNDASMALGISWFRSHPLSKDRHDKLLKLMETVDFRTISACKWVKEDAEAVSMAKYFS